MKLLQGRRGGRREGTNVVGKITKALTVPASTSSLPPSTQLLMFPSKCSLFHSSTSHAFRALVYPQAGKPPSSVLKAQTFKPLSPPSSHQARVKILLSPINPADINVLEGVYPAKPEPRSDLIPLVGDPQTLSIAGNEAVGVIAKLGGDGAGLRVGDRVILDKSQLGVWATYQNVDLKNLVKVHDGVSDVAAATLRVSFPSSFYDVDLCYE